MPKIRKRKFKAKCLEMNGEFRIRELEGTEITIPGYEMFTFVYHKFPGIPYKRISEFKTGASVVTYVKTKAEAIQQAKKKLDNKLGSPNAVQKRMEYIKDHCLDGEYQNVLTTQMQLPI